MATVPFLRGWRRAMEWRVPNPVHGVVEFEQPDTGSALNQRRCKCGTMMWSDGHRAVRCVFCESASSCSANKDTINYIMIVIALEDAVQHLYHAGTALTRHGRIIIWLKP